MKKLILFLMLLTACARNPATGRREIVLVSESQEIAMGQESDVQAREEYGVVDNAALQAYVQAMGRKLVAVSHRPNLEWHFTVVDSPVVNAFAIPGGYVYLTRGILAYLGNEAELAGVIGHEIAHVTARHTVRQLTRAQLAQIGLGVGSVLSPTFGQFGSLAENGLGLLFLRFSRDDEREADRLGVEYASRGATIRVKSAISSKCWDGFLPPVIVKRSRDGSQRTRTLPNASSRRACSRRNGSRCWA
jgi:predicted Zn-dependent protease